MVSGRVFVISFSLLLAAAAGLALFVIVRNADEVGINQAAIGLEKVGKGASVWAGANQGEYPAHIALMRKSRYFDPDWLRDPRQPEGTVWVVEGVDARPFMDEEVSLEAAEGLAQRLDRSPLVAAVERHAADATNEIYRFGDYWFVRLPRNLGRNDLIFGWTLADGEGGTSIMFDSGEVRRVTAQGWRDAWEKNQQARTELGLPALEFPAD